MLANLKVYLSLLLTDYHKVKDHLKVKDHHKDNRRLQHRLVAMALILVLPRPLWRQPWRLPPPRQQQHHR